MEDGRVGFIDFGIVSKISEKVWTAVSDLVQAFVNADYEGVADALVSKILLALIFSTAFNNHTNRIISFKFLIFPLFPFAGSYGCYFWGSG